MTLAVAAVLIATGVLSLHKTTAADTRPVVLPSVLADLSDSADVQSSVKGAKPAVVEAARANNLKTAQRTAAAYSKASGGAPAGVRTYSDSNSERNAVVIAVRAASPGLTIGPVLDPDYLGLAQSQQRVETTGDVDCVIFAQQLTPKGQPIADDNDLTTICQRTGPTLTVQVHGSRFTGPTGRDHMVAVVNAAWTAVHEDQ